MRRFLALKGFAQQIVRGMVWRSFLIGLVPVLVLGGTYGLFFAGTSSSAVSTSVSAVERRTLTSSVKATGKVTFGNEQQMRFNQKGKVAKVSFKEGDRVKKGQVIAELDASSVLADIRQAQLSVGASALQLQQLEGDKEKSVLDAQNALRESERQFTDAQNALDVAKEKLPTDVAAAERDVKAAEAALEQAKVTTIRHLAGTAESVFSQSEDLLDGLYGDLVHDSSTRNTYGNDVSIEIYYRLYNDYALKNETENAYYAARQAIVAMHAEYGASLATLQDAGDLEDALTDARAAADAVHALADSMYRLVQGATDDPSDFTVADINAIKQHIVSARSSANGLMTDADTALASFTGGGKNLTSIAIQQKMDALANAQENLKILQTQTPGDLQQQQAALKKVQDDYASKQLAAKQTAKNSDVDYLLQQNAVAQRATSLIKAQKTLDDYHLTAPFDGVIRRLDYQVGDNLLDTGEDKYVTIENPEFLIVTVQLDQTDVVRVKRGMSGTILFDALPGETFVGTIDDINATPIETSGVVSYEVQIKLPTPQNVTILSGMTTTVQIVTTRKENVLAVPNLALKHQNGGTSVTLEDGSVVPVEIGDTDGRYTEILSGLTEGQNVLSMNVTVTAAATANANSAQQIFRLGTGGGGGLPGGGATRAVTR